MIPFSAKMAREELLQKFSAKFGPEKGKTMEEAVAFATAVHEGQKRESGEPYIIHPIAVAEYLMDMGMDSATVIAGVLHDTVEDGKDISLDEISKRFSAEVAHLVDGVTKLTRSGQKEGDSETGRRSTETGDTERQGPDHTAGDSADADADL